MKTNIPELYYQYFVHITPSFFIENMVYVDTDRRTARFFGDPAVIDFIENRKSYKVPPSISFLQADFTKPLPLSDNSFDILISLYAGFISQHCKQKLKTGGILVANNSHGDSSIAFSDQDFELLSVIKRKGKKFRLMSDGLDSYFQKKNGSPVDRKKVLQRMACEAFSKTAYAYVFTKVQ